MTTTTYQAFLFDMDGVIIDTHAAVTAWWYELAARHNVTLTETIFAQHIYGCTAEYTIATVFSHLSAEDVAATFADLHDYEVNRTVYQAVPGVLDLLRDLQGSVPVALVTSGERHKVDAVFRQLQLDAFFDATVSADDVHNGKPHPEPYLTGARLLGKAAERCIVFEDSRAGVQAAVGSGALCIGVRPPDSADIALNAGAAAVISDFKAVRWAGGALHLPTGEHFPFAL